MLHSKKIKYIWIFIICINLGLALLGCNSKSLETENRENIVLTTENTTADISSINEEKVDKEQNSVSDAKINNKIVTNKPAVQNIEIKNFQSKNTEPYKSEISKINNASNNTNSSVNIKQEPTSVVQESSPAVKSSSSTAQTTITTTTATSESTTTTSNEDTTPTIPIEPSIPTTDDPKARTTPPTLPTTVSVSSDAVIAYAANFLGTPYLYGGTTPQGFDDSGFVQYVFKHFNISVGRLASEQAKAGTAVSKDDLKVGDIIFFGTKDSHVHVGIYVGNNSYIHSPSTNDVVKVSSLSGKDFAGARRVINQ